MIIPPPYDWLNREPGPRLLRMALLFYSVMEKPGTANNPEIMAWAKEVGLEGFYTGDSIPWCGLFMAVVAKRCGYDTPLGLDMLRALKWGSWGIPAARAGLGDVLVFQRPGGGHVGLYVGEDPVAYHVYGGNQSDRVGFTRIGKDRLKAVRRPKDAQGGRVVNLNAAGKLSTNEV